MHFDIEQWLPQDHFAPFLVEMADELDFSKIYYQYRGTGTSANVENSDTRTSDSVAEWFIPTFGGKFVKGFISS